MTVKRVGLAVSLALSAEQAMAQAIEGTATYRERMALPPAAVFEATVEDVSRADAPSSVLASTRIASPGNPPIAFTIPYDQAKVVSTHRYVVRARILVDDKLLFTTDIATPVITSGNPTRVTLMLRRVGAGATAPGPQDKQGAPAPSGPASELIGTAWQLVKFQGGDDTLLRPDDKAKYTIAFEPAGRLTARIDCNRGRGTWKSPGATHIELGPLALTRAKCPEGSLHDRMVKQWSYVRSFLIKDGHLFLVLMADGGTYEFEPRDPDKR